MGNPCVIYLFILASEKSQSELQLFHEMKNNALQQLELYRALLW